MGVGARQVGAGAPRRAARRRSRIAALATRAVAVVPATVRPSRRTTASTAASAVCAGGGVAHAEDRHQPGVPAGGVIDDRAFLEQRDVRAARPTTIGSRPRCTSRTAAGVSPARGNARRASASKAATWAGVPCAASASPSWTSWLVPTIETSRHGTTKRKRPSTRRRRRATPVTRSMTRFIARDSRAAGTATGAPTQPRSTAPAHGPAAFSTAVARTSKRSPVSRSSTSTPATRSPGPHQRPRLDVVGGHCAAGHSRLHRRQHHPLGLPHLVVEPHRAAGDAGRVDERIELRGTVARHDAARAAVAGTRRRCRRCGRRPTASVTARAARSARALRVEMAVGRDTEGQGLHQVRRHAGHGPAFADEQPHLRQAQALQRSQAAVQRLQAVEGRAAAEVAAVDQRHPQAPLRRIPCGQGAVDAGADDEQIEGVVRQPAQIAHQPSHCTIAGCDHRSGPPLLERAHPRSRDDHASGGQPRVLRRSRRLSLRQAALPARARRLRRLRRPAPARSGMRHRHRPGPLRRWRRDRDRPRSVADGDRPGDDELRRARAARRPARRRRRGRAVPRRLVRRRLRPRRAAVRGSARTSRSPKRTACWRRAVRPSSWSTTASRG